MVATYAPSVDRDVDEAFDAGSLAEVALHGKGFVLHG